MGIGAGRLIAIAAQFIVPPLFLKFYGVGPYGEYLALTAAASYLSSLNFGVATYCTNQLAIYRKQNDWLAYDRLQASAQIMVGAVVLGAALLSVGALTIPWSAFLNLSMAPRDAELIACLVGLQCAASISAGYYGTLFTVVEQVPRAALVANVRIFVTGFVCVPFLFWQSSLIVVALAGLLATLFTVAWSVWFFRKTNPNVPMGLGAAHAETIRQSLMPSWYLGLSYVQNLLIFQAPLVVLQNCLGPASVVAFSISRMMFGLPRQVVSLLTQAVQPEITYSYGSGNRQQLLYIYLHSERVLSALIAACNVGLLALAPTILAIWLGEQAHFDFALYGAMAVVSSTMSMKDHRLTFQLATNRHRTAVLMTFGASVAFVVAGYLSANSWGLVGFVVTWLATELVATWILAAENNKLLGCVADRGNFPKLLALVAGGVVICWFAVTITEGRGHALRFAVGLTAALILLLASVRAYGLGNRLRDAAMQFGLRGG